MGFIRFAFKTTLYGGVTALTAGTVGTAWYLRKVKEVPFGPDAAEFSTDAYHRINPQGYGSLHDEFVRRVPVWALDDDYHPDREDASSRSSMLQKLFKSEERRQQEQLAHWLKGLGDSYVQGFFGSIMFAVQAYFLRRWYLDPSNPDMDYSAQYWTREQFDTGAYPEGQHISNHFEIVSRSTTPQLDRTEIRCGDSPLVQGVRSSDGLVTLKVSADPYMVTFACSSILLNGQEGAPGKSPLPQSISWLHRIYVALLLEGAVRHVIRNHQKKIGQ